MAGNSSSSHAGEPIIEPSLPIVDAHHHLWFHPGAAEGDQIDPNDTEVGPLRQNYARYPRYLFDELLDDTRSGHNIRATVYVQVHSMYRRDGPEELRSVGEVEFANGMAAMAASGTFGEVALCAAIVGGADLRMGDRVRPVLEAHIAAGGGRYRGIRPGNLAWDARLPRLNAVMEAVPGLIGDAAFHAGFRHLGELGLSCDIFLFEPQLPELPALADAFPDTTIVLNHAGMPIGLGDYAGSHAERFPIWRENLFAVAKCPNVVLKVGGLGNAMCGFPSLGDPDTVGSELLAEKWRPYIETCIEAFGAQRCMLESNFPVDGVTVNYPVLWNTFKRITAGATADEKAALYAGTATKTYKLDLQGEEADGC